MSTATDGRRREHQVRDHLTTHGWRLLMRAAGSKGSADLAMVSAEHGLALVQVGSRSKRLDPADRARFLADADDAGALALLAVVVPRQPITYWQVTSGSARTWHRWTPEEADR